MKESLIGLAVYALVYPIIVRLICVAHTEVFIKRKQMRTPKSRQSSLKLPDPIWPKLKQHVAFALKDERPMSFGKKEPSPDGIANKKVVKIIWFLGLITSGALAYMGMWEYFAVGAIFFCLAIIFSFVVASPILKGRRDIMTKLFQIGQSTLGLSAEHANNPNAVIQIVEWREILTPSKIVFQIPTTFSDSGCEGFLRQFNQVFGQESTWVPFNDMESGKPGWNFADGVLTIREVPPLPTRAPFSAHYVLDPGIAWSFFPIALGVENGVELMNPETGQTENVLGFDLSGEQVGLSRKLGNVCSPQITTSPMVFIGGTTGGGKALSVDTKVLVKRTESKSE